MEKPRWSSLPADPVFGGALALLETTRRYQTLDQLRCMCFMRGSEAIRFPERMRLHLATLLYSILARQSTYLPAYLPNLPA
jgi:hypothetical protein